MKKTLLLTVILLLALALCACRASTDGPEVNAPDTSGSTQQPTVPACIEVQREGELSQIPVQPVTGTVGSYIIAMDPSYFTFKSQGSADIFSYENWPGDHPVFYSISSYTYAYDPEAFFADMQVQYAKQYTSCSSEAVTVAGFDATLVRFESHKDAPAYNRHIYLIDCGSARYIIETEFTTEMYEGLYAIIRATINTFTPLA